MRCGWHAGGVDYTHRVAGIRHSIYDWACHCFLVAHQRSGTERNIRRNGINFYGSRCHDLLLSSSVVHVLAEVTSPFFGI